MTSEDAGPSEAAPARAGTGDRAFKVIALVAGVCLLGFIAVVVVRAQSPGDRVLGVAGLRATPPAHLVPGSVAPGFSLPRLHGGPPVTLAAFRGTPVIVSFFASWCPDCRSELAAMGAVARQATGRVAVVGVDSNDTSDGAAARVLAAAGATYPVGVDAHAGVATAYLLTALPVTYFVDPRGRVAGVAFGALSEATLQQWVQRLAATR